VAQPAPAGLACGILSGYISGMNTRIDHATVVTSRDGKVVTLTDTSITFSGGVIRHVGPTEAVRAAAAAARSVSPAELRGRPLGRILEAAGKITRQQIDQALELQRARHGVIGQTLVQLGYVTDADVDWALSVQAGRDAGPVPGSEPAEVIDATGRLIIPGLINTHHHLYQSLTRGMPEVQNVELFDWLVNLYPIWERLDDRALHAAATISLAELLLSGCTTSVDHMYLFPCGSDVRLDSVVRAAGDLGMRIHACRGSMTLGASQGGLPPDRCVEQDDRVLADCERVIAELHDPKPLAVCRIDLAPCAPFNVTPELFDQVRQLARERNVLLHTHIAETLDEQRYCLERFGVRPVEYLRQHDWLGPDVYLAHCVHLNREEIELFARTGTGVAHCPSSNMRLGSGIAPIRAMLDAGVRVGLAVDGSSSNDGGNLLAEARQTLLLQRVSGGAKALTVAEAFRLATVGGADVLCRPELGRIEPGAAADLVIYDANDVALAGAVAHDPLGALVLCHPPRPLRVIVNGRTVVENGRITGVDLPKVVADFNQMVRDRFTGK